MEINSFGAVWISIPFLAGIRKCFLYFVFEYFIAIYISLEKHIAFGVIKILQISLNNCASKNTAANTTAGFRIQTFIVRSFQSGPH